MLFGTIILVALMLNELSAAPPLTYNGTFNGNPTGE